MSAILLGDEIVHYEVLGRGRPLIFLHGWTGSWRYWVPAMQSASVSFRAYALDLWGFGESARYPTGYPLESQVELLDGFLQELGIGKVALAGHGLGAAVALLFGRRYPRLVDRIMATGLTLDGQGLSLRLAGISPVELADWLVGRVPGGEIARQEAAKTDPQAVLAALTSLAGLNLPKILAELSAPCLLVAGGDDPLLEDAADLAGSLPEHSHQVVFEGCGHFPMVEAAGKFHRLLADFLALGPGASPRQLQLKEEWKRRVR